MAIEYTKEEIELNLYETKHFYRDFKEDVEISDAIMTYRDLMEEQDKLLKIIQNVLLKNIDKNKSKDEFEYFINKIKDTSNLQKNLEDFIVFMEGEEDEDEVLNGILEELRCAFEFEEELRFKKSKYTYTNEKDRKELRDRID